MKKSIIRFTTKQGYTARPDIRLAGGLDYLERVARETLRINHADAYTFGIEHGGSIRHYSADSGKRLNIC